MSDRKAELERKRKKLEEIRRAREEKKRHEQDASRHTASKAAATADSSESDLERRKREADELLKGIIPDDVISGTAVRAGKPPEAKQHEQQEAKPISPVKRRAMPKLGVSKLNQTDIPPKEPVLYSKETQTIVPQEPQEEEEEIPPVPAPQPEPEQQVEAEDEKKPEKEEVRVVDLSEEQKQQILMSNDFQRFFERTARLVEKALSEPDYTFDYGLQEGEEAEGNNKAATRLSYNRTFFDDRWCKHRTVTCLDWSTQYPELLVSSYNNNEDAPNEPDGVALVWNIKYQKTSPEYVFHCQSPVMSTSFAKFHPNLIVGGTYSGTIVLWDNRSNKKTPVQRSPLSASAHTHPVYNVDVIGTQNAHNLISISTDGRMCSWSLDMLSQPQEAMDLQFKQSKPVAVTCMSFLAGDVNNFIVGSEEGAVYTACRHGSKAGISDLFEGHSGPATGIDCHSASGPIDFSHLFITSSFDWSVKLWSTKSARPLYSFEDNNDYVYDVQWSPIHPALFATVDGNGRLDLWNLNNDTEVPVTSVTVGSSCAVNKLRWTASGLQIAVGDDDGKVHIYNVGEQIAVPRNDEWSRFERTLDDIQAQATSTVGETVGSPTRTLGAPTVKSLFMP